MSFFKTKKNEENPPRPTKTGIVVRTATCTKGPLSGGIGNVQTFLLLLLDNGDRLSVEMSVYPSGKRNFIREGDLVKYYSDHDEYIEVTFKEDLPSDG